MPLSCTSARGYACPMEHRALQTSASNRRNAKAQSARVTDPGCDTREKSLPDTIQLSYPRPRPSATRLFLEDNFTQLRLCRNNYLDTATAGGCCLTTTHPYPAMIGGTLGKQSRPARPRRAHTAGRFGGCSKEGAGWRGSNRCCGPRGTLGRRFRLAVPPHDGTLFQCAREGCPAMDTVVPFYRYPALAFYGTIVLQANQWLFRSFAHD